MLFSAVDNDLNNKQYHNFLAAVNNNSTFNYFAVIRVENLNSGEIKQVCCKGNFIMGALDIEHHDNSIIINNCLKNKDRFFQFKNKKALDNISFFDYNPKELVNFQKKYDFDRIGVLIDKDKKFSIQLPDHDMKLFAHILFNKGYLTGESDCFGGTLEYINQ